MWKQIFSLYSLLCLIRLWYSDISLTLPPPIKKEGGDKTSIENYAEKTALQKCIQENQLAAEFSHDVSNYTPINVGVKEKNDSERTMILLIKIEGQKGER